MANGEANGKTLQLYSAPVWVLAVVLILRVVFDFLGPTLGIAKEPVSQASVDRLTAQMVSLTEAVRDLSDLEERRMQRTELTYRPDEWRALVRQVDEIHRRTGGGR